MFDFLYITYFSKWLNRRISALGTALNLPNPKKLTGDTEIDKLIADAGFAYDEKQNIFYSLMYPWQRKFGYCRLYDDIASSMGMIVDSEPIHFEYEGEKWLIEFWKGQYDLTMGGEIGVYKTGKDDVSIPKIFTGTYYDSVDDSERLQMSFTIKKDGIPLFTREDTHWWLTGFILGEFTEPSDLTMEISVTLLNPVMCDAFVGGLKKAGYEDDAFDISGTTVSFVFTEPHTKQPFTRTPITDSVIQFKNKLMCEEYKKIVDGCDAMSEKLAALNEKAPELIPEFLKMGKSRELYQLYDAIFNIPDKE